MFGVADSLVLDLADAPLAPDALGVGAELGPLAGVARPRQRVHSLRGRTNQVFCALPTRVLLIVTHPLLNINC